MSFKKINSKYFNCSIEVKIGEIFISGGTLKYDTEKNCYFSMNESDSDPLYCPIFVTKSISNSKEYPIATLLVEDDLETICTDGTKYYSKYGWKNHCNQISSQGANLIVLKWPYPSTLGPFSSHEDEINFFPLVWFEADLLFLISTRTSHNYLGNFLEKAFSEIDEISA